MSGIFHHGDTEITEKKTPFLRVLCVSVVNSTVMAGPDPAIHAFKTWMPGTSPGMTE